MVFQKFLAILILLSVSSSTFAVSLIKQSELKFQTEQSFGENHTMKRGTVDRYDKGVCYTYTYIKVIKNKVPQTFCSKTLCNKQLLDSQLINCQDYFEGEKGFTPTLNDAERILIRQLVLKYNMTN